MTQALRIHKTGGPEVFVWEEVALEPPGPKEARLRHTAKEDKVSFLGLVLERCHIWIRRRLAFCRDKERRVGM